MLIAHKIELNPNNKQATYFAKASGVARFAYNWALNEWKNQYDAGGKPSDPALRRQLNNIKHTEYPWMLEVTKNAPQMAIIQLGNAFKNFFAKRADFPRFRKKGINDRFTLTNDQFRIDASRIHIPKLGWVRMRETLRFIGKIMSATVSRIANRWFVSVTVDTSEKLTLPARENQVAVGVDLGVSNFVTLSTGEALAGPKPHKQLLLRLRRLSKSLSRKQKGSSNRKKARLKLSQLYYRMANIRRDAIHKATTQLTSCFSVIGIENLNVKGMMKNRRLSRAIGDMGFHEFRRQLDYKVVMRGGVIVLVDRWFPSSKLCSHCGYKMESLPLSIRTWTCEQCHEHHHRDINAAINLEKMAVSSTVSACGASSGGTVARASVSYGVMKQESNTNLPIVNYG